MRPRRARHGHDAPAAPCRGSRLLGRGFGDRRLRLCRWDHTSQGDFTPLLFSAAAGGDGVAEAILQKSGKSLARDVLSVYRALRFPAGAPVPVVLLGSLFTKAACSIQMDAMKSRLAESGVPFSCRLLAAPPVAGAVRWGLELLGADFDPETVMKQTAALEAKRSGGISHENP